MDTGLINVDISFGDLDDKESLEVKKSPSHESDSGISIMSSPQHSVISDFDNDEDASFRPLSPPSLEQFGNLFDNELTSYMASETESNEDIEVESILTTLPVDANRHGYQHQISSDSQDSDIVLKPQRIVSKTSESLLERTPTTSTADRQTNSKPLVLPPVKVIKVITAPNSSSRVQMEQEIFEAIDEKNKKNAKQAKVNREKKKAYIQSLEEEVVSLKSLNANMNSKLDNLQSHKNALEEEVEYLKSVLANQSTLSTLLKNIPNASAKLSSSFGNRKRSANHDHDYNIQAKSAKKSKTAGVCLHVENEIVSLEFCASCSKKAHQGNS